MTLGEKAVELAKQSVGVREETPNWGKWIRVYLASVGIGFPAPWCGAFVNFKIGQAAKEMGIASAWLHTGSCTALGQWARHSFNLLEKPEPGCVFLVKNRLLPGRFTHTGFVAAVTGDGMLETVEGNSNTDGSAEGYEVTQRLRSPGNCVFVRVM